MSDDIGITLKELQNLGEGEFYIKAQNNIPIKTKMLSHLVQYKNSMSEKEWQEMKIIQKKKYYSEIEEIQLQEQENIVGEYKDSAHNRKPPQAP